MRADTTLYTIKVRYGNSVLTMTADEQIGNAFSLRSACIGCRGRYFTVFPVWLLSSPCSVCCHLSYYKNWLIDWLIARLATRLQRTFNISARLEET